MANLVCPLVEVVFEYCRLIVRPLTRNEQRSFLHLLDKVDMDDGWKHGSECICMDLLPTVVQKLAPDPVDCVVAERTLEDQSYRPERGHWEKVEHWQGITLNSKTRREQTKELTLLLRDMVRDLNIICHELAHRGEFAGHKSLSGLLKATVPAIHDDLKRSRRKKQQQEEWRNYTPLFRELGRAATEEEIMTAKKKAKGKKPLRTAGKNRIAAKARKPKRRKLARAQ